MPWLKGERERAYVGFGRRMGDQKEKGGGHFRVFNDICFTHRSSEVRDLHRPRSILLIVGHKLGTCDSWSPLADMQEGLFVLLSFSGKLNRQVLKNT